MGIVIEKQSLHPYKNVSTVDESEHTSINMEMGMPNGMSSESDQKFHKQRWNQMLSRPSGDRFTAAGNGKEVRPAAATSGRQYTRGTAKK